MITEIETVHNLKLHNCFEENILQLNALENVSEKPDSVCVDVIPANFCIDIIIIINFHVLVERHGAFFCLIFNICPLFHQPSMLL